MTIRMPAEFAIESLNAPTALLQETALYEATRDREMSAVSRVLSAMIAATDARFGLIEQKENTAARNLFGQRDDGSTIRRPDKLLCPDHVADALRSGKPILRLHRPRSGKWSLALPVLSGKENRVVLFLGGKIPPDDSLFSHITAEDVARWTSCLSTAVYVDRLKAEVRQLKGAVARAHENPRNVGLRLASMTTNERPMRPSDQERPVSIPEIIGESVAIQKVFQLISVVSRGDLPVLIEGESGTGKELVARAIHRLSERRDANFVSENCGAIPANLVETEFFGSVQGAYTGSTESKPGIFEVADRGTVFLDEIAEMDLETQKRLLRVLQDHEIRRVGSSTPRRVDFRVISATNLVLADQVEKGRFRQDLYFRLNVATIVLPPLRARRNDIQLLIDHFCRESCKQYGRRPMKFSRDALDRLTAYPWPGNIRELQNEILRLACTGTIRINPGQLSERILRQSWPSPGQKLMKEEPLLALPEIESQLMAPVVTEAIRNASGNIAEAARRLKITRSALYRRLKRYGIKGS